MVVHHTGRATSKPKPRGSTALDGHADAVMVLRRLDNTGLVTLQNTKQRYGKLFDPVTLWPHEIGLEDGRSSLVLMTEDDGLRPFHYVLLNRLYISQEPLGYAELGERSKRSDKTVRNHVNHLLASGHVELAGTEGRGRRKLFKLTGKTWGTPIWDR